jgi:hypothetical protein
MAALPRVLVAGVEPGGAQCAAAAAHRLIDDGFTVVAFAKGPGAARFAAVGVPCTELDGEVPESDLAATLLDRERYDIVLTGTSMGSFLERWLWVEAAHRRIPSAAILDAWVNVGVRLSWTDFHGIPGADSSLFGEVRPNIFFCPDEATATRTRTEVANPGTIVVSGHPWIEWTQRRWSHRPRDAHESTRFLCLSEPILQDYGTSVWGYTQLDTLNLLVDAIRQGVAGRPCELLVRPHPREAKQPLEDILAKLAPASWRWALEGQALDHATTADLTCGMSSMALLEAWACGCPTLSLLPGLLRESPYLPDQMKWDRSVVESGKVFHEIQRRLALPPQGVPPVFMHDGASRIISDTLKEMR